MLRGNTHNEDLRESREAHSSSRCFCLFSRESRVPLQYLPHCLLAIRLLWQHS